MVALQYKSDCCKSKKCSAAEESGYLEAVYDGTSKVRDEGSSGNRTFMSFKSGFWKVLFF